MKAGTILLLSAALSVLANTRAVAADLRLGKAEPIVPVSAAMDSRERAVRAHAVLQGMDEHRPLAYSAFALAEEGADEGFPSTRGTRLYAASGSDASTRGAAPAAPASAAKEDEERARRVKKATLPVPGSWAMILAGLLGVGAIARRRMSA